MMLSFTVELQYIPLAQAPLLSPVMTLWLSLQWIACMDRRISWTDLGLIYQREIRTAAPSTTADVQSYWSRLRDFSGRWTYLGAGADLSDEMFGDDVCQCLQQPVARLGMGVQPFLRLGVRGRAAALDHVGHQSPLSEWSRRTLQRPVSLHCMCTSILTGAPANPSRGHLPSILVLVRVMAS